MPATNTSVYFFDTNSEYLKFEKSFINLLKHDFGKVNGKKAITKVEVTELTDGSPMWVISRREFNPEATRPTPPSPKYYPLRDVSRLHQLIPELRAGHLPPVQPGISAFLKYPQTDIQSGNDIVILMPSAMEILAGIDSFDFDAMEADTNESYNAFTVELDPVARKGILETTEKKREGLRARSIWDKQMKDAIGSTSGSMASIFADVSKDLSTDRVLDMFDDLLESGNLRESQFQREVGNDFRSLQKGYEHVLDLYDDAETTGDDAFVETISTEGIILPPRIYAEEGNDPFRAVRRIGFSSRRTLFGEDPEEDEHDY